MGTKKNPMDEIKKLTEEEKKAETSELEAAQAIKEDDVRAQIIEEYGFDETDDSDKIDKLVNKEMDNAKKLSSAIGQKIKQREKADGLEKELEDKTPKPEEKKEEKKKTSEEELGEKIGEGVNAELEKRDLEALGYPEELTKEIKDLAALKNLTIKEILKDPYIVSRVEAHEETEESEGASITNKPENNKGGKKKLDINNPPVVDMATKEGREKHEAWKKEMIAKGY